MSQIKKTHQCFGGTVRFCEHRSAVTKTVMNYSAYLPAGEIRGGIIWLSGLTCSEENFMAKAGAFAALNENGMAVFCPDTSPRGLDLAGEKDHWDFGVGAGFYVDATTPIFRDNYRMYSYVSDEFYNLVCNDYKITKPGIMGHSMGGHGALVIGLRNPDKFTSISAFSPIVNPTHCPWGVKAFTGYLGAQSDAWQAYDTCALIKHGAYHQGTILVDQGTADQFLAEQLLTSNLMECATTSKQLVNVRMQAGYDHSYYFIATFIADHIRFHAEAL